MSIKADRILPVALLFMFDTENTFGGSIVRVWMPVQTTLTPILFKTSINLLTSSIRGIFLKVVLPRLTSVAAKR